MRWHRFFSRARVLFSGARHEDDFNDELRTHLALLTARFEQAGMPHDEAVAAAHRQFGNVSATRQSQREDRSFLAFEQLKRDTSYALRSLRHSPVFTVTAVATLALGIGAATAIFTVANQILLQLLPVPNPQQLVLFRWNGRFIGGRMFGGNQTFSYPAYTEFRDNLPPVFSGVAARYQSSIDVTDGGSAQQAVGELVSGGYFHVLGVHAALGRLLTAADDRVRNAEPYVVLSYDYWTRRFGANPSVLNRVIAMNGTPMTVVGVAQRGFSGFERMSPSDVFVPMMMKSEFTPTWDDMYRRNTVWVQVFARLRPDVSPKSAQQQISVLFHRVLESDLTAISRDAKTRAEYLHDWLSLEPAAAGFDEWQQQFARPLRVLLAMVAILLLIGCMNVAGLLLTRAAGREKELAVRLALGATRASLIRLILVESLAIALLGGMLGLILAPWTAAGLVRMLPLEASLPTAPDSKVLLFTLAVSMGSALIFGLVPALQTTRRGHGGVEDALAPALKDGSRGATSGGHAHIRRVLVAGEVALALVLLTGAGLFVRSLEKLMSVDTGIKPAYLVSFSIDPSLHRYSPERTARFIADFNERLAHLPGVLSSSAAQIPVLAGAHSGNTVFVQGHQPKSMDDHQTTWNAFLPGAFTTLGASLIDGRDFTQKDVLGEPQVAIVNETFAHEFAPGGRVVGLRAGFGEAGPAPLEIVGVVKDIKDAALNDAPKPAFYTPLLQADHWFGPAFYLRVDSRFAPDPLAVIPGVRHVLASMDASIPLTDVKTVSAQMDETQYVNRMFAILSGAFGVLSTLLAAIGLYGVTAFSVARRTREIGVRMALGASRASVLGLVTREILILTIVGFAIGVPLILAGGGLVQSQLFEIQASDWTITTVAGAIILAAALAAAVLPGWRAARINPTEALRYQ